MNNADETQCKQIIPKSIPEIYFPTDIFTTSHSDNYMDAANCLAADFFHPKFKEFCAVFRHPPILHRKLWEWAFIYEHLNRQNCLGSGNRGLGFGVGEERLPSLFASQGTHILATDAPPAVSDSGWKETGQHASGREVLYYKDLIERADFEARIAFEEADMNRIGPHLSGFDFCWSACCFEHLGSIRLGLDFVRNSVKTLRAGGVAVHTTELNISSNDKTVEEGGTVLFRKSDLDQLAAELIEDGNTVISLPIAVGSSYIDHLVDVPPFEGNPHLKLRLGEFVTTSVGIVVVRGDMSSKAI